MATKKVMKKVMKKATKKVMKKHARERGGTQMGAHSRSTTASIIAKARAAREAADVGGGEYFRMKTDRIKIRLVPFEHDGEQELVVPTGGYFSLPGQKFVPFIGPECPILAVLNRYPGEARAAKYRLIQRYAMNVVVRGGDEKCQIWEMPTTVFRALEDYIGDEEFGEACFSLEDGFDFIITRTGAGMDTEYAVKSSPNKSRCNPLTDPIDILERIASQAVPDLEEIAEAIEQEFLQ